MTLDQAIVVVRNSPPLVGSVKLCEAVDLVLAALAEREHEHTTWEWWTQHSRRLYYDLRTNGFSTQEDGPWEDTPLAAVLAAKAAEEGRK